MMNIGIDFYDTITTDPKFFKNYTDILIAAGAKVYVVSAIYEKNLRNLQKDFRKTHINAELVPVFYKEFSQVPKLKLQACKDKDIRLMIDDRLDTCQFLSLNGIMAFRIVI